MPGFEVQARLQLQTALIELARLEDDEPIEVSRRDDAYRLNFSLTPRRPEARGCYLDRWAAHRFGAIGPLLALPPGESLRIENAGRHSALICHLRTEAVQKWLPDSFDWTDRRLEACLDVTNANLRGHLVRLARELPQEALGGAELAEAISVQVSIELARHLIGVAESAVKGGLASWRLRALDRRLAEPGMTPTLAELADLCRISQRQLTRGFRTSRGCSIGEYISQFRLEAAKERLVSNESIKAVAGAMGFASPSAFAHAFRRATGATPRQFRARVSAGDEAYPSRSIS
jgi:AraC family transcriptional regulator